MGFSISNQQSTIPQGTIMVKAVSTYLFVKERLHPGILDGLARTGVQAIEIFAARQHFDYANRKAHIREIADWFRGSDVTLNSVHSPLYSDYEWGRAGSPPLNLASTDRAGSVEAMDEVKRALEIAEQIPFRYLVQHLGVVNESFSEKKFDSAMTSIEHLRAFAKPLGVRILLENIPNELSTPEKLMAMIHDAHFDDVGICFDFGHAHLMSSVSEAFEILREQICSTHVHDNRRDKDSHLWPGGGTIDWKEAMEKLCSAPLKPPLLLELEGDETVSALERLAGTFEKLEGIE
jgi:sugar phosphate isomerase/epimerase